MSERDRADDVPPAPEPAPPEEPQTSVHEQAIQPEREDEPDDELPAG